MNDTTLTFSYSLILPFYSSLIVNDQYLKMITFLRRYFKFAFVIFFVLVMRVKSSETKSIGNDMVQVTASKVSDPVFSRKVYKPGTSPQIRGVKPISVVLKNSTGSRILMKSKQFIYVLPFTRLQGLFIAVRIQL